MLPRRPDGSVGMALVLPALTDCRWWLESLLVHSGVSSATRRKATGADQKKKGRENAAQVETIHPDLNFHPCNILSKIKSLKGTCPV